MISEFCGMNEDLLQTLIDSYDMTKWEMTWLEFLALAQKEINEYMQDLLDNADTYFGKDEEESEE